MLIFCLQSIHVAKIWATEDTNININIKVFMRLENFSINKPCCRKDNKV